MPGLFTNVAHRVNDAVDEWNERKEDAETGRRNKYGLKTNLWYEEEDRRKRRKNRHRRHGHRGDGNKGRNRGEGSERQAREDDFMMSGGNDDASTEARGRDIARDEEGDDVIEAEEHHQRRRRRHRSRSRNNDRVRSLRNSRSQSRSRDDADPLQRRRRNRGEEESPVEIMERMDVPYSRELPPQVDGAPPVYGPPQMYGAPQVHAPPGVYGPPPLDRISDRRGQRQRPKDPPQRHPNMKPYDGGGLISLVKAIKVNLIQEQQRRKSKGQNPYGLAKERAEPPKSREHGSQRRGRTRGTRAPPSTPSLTSLEGEIPGLVHPGTPRHESPAHSEEHVEPSMEPALEAEHHQAEDTDAEHARDEARHMEEGHAASSHHSEVSSMPPSTIDEPQSLPPEYRSHGPTRSHPAARGSSSHPASVAGSSLGRPSEHSEHGGSRDSGEESDHSGASASATVRTNHTRSTPQTSRSPPSEARGRAPGLGRGRGGNKRSSGMRGGAGCNDEIGDDFYSLHESYDDEYVVSPHSQFQDERPLYYENGDPSQTRIHDARPLDREHHDRIPNHWNSASPNGRPQFFSSGSGFQGWSNRDSQQRQPQLMQLPGTNTWVTMEQYQYYLQHPQPPSRLPQAFRHYQPRQGDHQPRTSDPHTYPSARSCASWPSGVTYAFDPRNNHRSPKGPDSSLPGESAAPGAGRSDLEAQSFGGTPRQRSPERSPGRGSGRDTAGKGYSNCRSKHQDYSNSLSESELSDSSESSSENDYKRRVPPGRSRGRDKRPRTKSENKPEPKSETKPKSKPKSETKPKSKYKSGPEASAHYDRPSQHEPSKLFGRRSPRPYNRSGTRAFKSKEESSDSASDSEIEGAYGFGRYTFDETYNCSDDSRSDDGFSSSESRYSETGDGSSYSSSETSSSGRCRFRRRKRSHYYFFDDSDDYEGKPRQAPAVPERPKDFYAVLGLMSSANANE